MVKKSAKKIKEKSIPPTKTIPEGQNPKSKPDIPIEKEKITGRNLINVLFKALGDEANEENKKQGKETIKKYLQQLIDSYEISKKYNIVFLYDEGRMIQSDADSIYAAVASFSEKKPILLVLHSTGGYIEPAYLIGKLLHEYSADPLNIVVPRRAKSAATLVCCAADRIHMGSLSELGPIDPQLDNLPALALKSSIEHIAELVTEFPQATNLFAQYLSITVKPIHIGHYERIAKSAVQYAERLLYPHKDILKKSPHEIAEILVYSYKDHSFVIDRQEARNIFGESILQHNTKEYELGNAIYKELGFISRIVGAVGHDFYFNGSLTATDPTFIKRRKK